MIAYNTVLAKGAGIVVSLKEGGPEYPREVSANAVFAANPIVAAGAWRNLAAPLDDAPSYLANAFASPPKLDLHPKPGWSGIVPGPTMAPMPFPDWGRDFDGQPRAAATVGAYDKGVTTGWRLQIGRKDLAPPARRAR